MMTEKYRYYEKQEQRVIYCFYFATKNHLLNLISRVWIEIHFLLKGPLFIISKSLMRSFVYQKTKKHNLQIALHW